MLAQSRQLQDQSGQRCSDEATGFRSTTIQLRAIAARESTSAVEQTRMPSSTRLIRVSVLALGNSAVADVVRGVARRRCEPTLMPPLSARWTTNVERSEARTSPPAGQFGEINERLG